MARRRRVVLALILAIGAAGTAVGLTAARFSGTTTEQIDIAAAPDWTAPTVSSTAIGRAAGYETGFIRQGAAFTYHVYANVSDSGNPAAGMGAVTTNVGSISTGSTNVTLTAGNYSAGGVSYNYRTATPIAPNTTVAAGSTAYTIGAVDLASPANTLTPPANGSVTVDNTAPAASGIATANGGPTLRRPEQNDTITFTYNDTIDPYSILANWTGASTSVVVRINNNVAATANMDQLLIANAANTAVLPITGVNGVNLGRNDYVTGARTFGASPGTASTMTRSGGTITIVLGTQSGAGTTAAANTGTMIWNPSATATDRAGNGAGTGAFSETGTADAEF
jgi:hypothetical protein